MDSETVIGINQSSILNEINEGCEKLIIETQRDLEIFRSEQQELQHQLLVFKEENNFLNNKLEQLKNATVANESRDDATRERLNNDVLKNASLQIDYLQVENKDLKSLNESHKKTIENLEKEIQNYRNQIFNSSSACEVKQKYIAVIKVLESTIMSQKSEIKEQTQVITNLFEQRKHMKDVIEKLQVSIEEKNKEISKYLETDGILKKLQHQLNEYKENCVELEKSLKLSKSLVDERYKREQVAIQKVQEALTVADIAMADKKEALDRQRILQEECETIASTIGQVMEEAAQKVEKEMEDMRKANLQKEKALLEEKTKLEEQIRNQNKLYEILNTKCFRLEEKYKNAASDNEKLLKQLELMENRIVSELHEMEQQHHRSYSKSQKKQSLGEQEVEIKYYVEKNKQLQESYRSTIHNLTHLFEKQICALQTEVTNLKAENSMLKARNVSTKNDQN
uniref:Uncharacterized protein n=1 Tax=Stomoxys calcitrans TaxID=35570 RepID=A0A1I8P7X9_STOCA